MYKSIIEIINIYVQRGYKLKYTNGSTLAIFDINGFYKVMIDILVDEPVYHYAATLFVDEEDDDSKYMYTCRDFNELERDVRPYEKITSLEKDVDKD